MEFSLVGISRAQLLNELKEERDVLTGCVANCLPIVRAHFAAELRGVLAFLEYLAAVPENAPQTGKESQTRCPHYRVIRRAFAIARDKGLNVKDDAAMTAAIELRLGMPIPSRDVLGAWHWKMVGDMIKSGVLAW